MLGRVFWFCYYAGLLCVTTVFTLTVILPGCMPLGVLYYIYEKATGFGSAMGVKEAKNLDRLSFIERFLTVNRAPFLVGLVLPLNVIWNASQYFMNRFYERTATPAQHDARVRKVVQQVKDWRSNSKDSGKRMVSARPGWLSINVTYKTYKDKNHKVFVHTMRDILEINEKDRYVRMEPGVTMGQTSRYLGPKGWTLPVVPEMDSLTVGGLVCGEGIECSSHKYGLFQDIVEELEVVTALGEVVTCSKEKNSDLFYSIFWSHGAIAFLVSAKIKIIPCKKYVRLTYHAFDSQREYVKFLNEQANNPDEVEFLEGLVYSQDRAVVMVGQYADAAGADGTVNPIGRWYKPWFYAYVQSFLGRKTPSVEYIPLRHYYHRHTRSIFWELRMIIPLGNTPLFRLFLGWLNPPSVSFLKRTQTNALYELQLTQHVSQDLMVPGSQLGQSINVCHEVYDTYPLWICPFRYPTNEGSFLRKPKDETIGWDVGVYGVPREANEGTFVAMQAHRKVEEFEIKIGGSQMLYAPLCTTPEEYEEMFDTSLQTRMRKKYGGDIAFVSTYDKMYWRHAGAAKTK